MAINHELWRVVASGGLNLLLAKMQSIADIDTRSRLLDKRDFLRWLRVELAASTSLAFAVSENVLGLLWDEVQNSAYYAPELREQDPPLVENASTSGGDTLTADAPAGEYTVMAYGFNGLSFIPIGTLATSSQPGAGNYVLAVSKDETDIIGLPSLFLELTS